MPSKNELLACPSCQERGELCPTCAARRDFADALAKHGPAMRAVLAEYVGPTPALPACPELGRGERAKTLARALAAHWQLNFDALPDRPSRMGDRLGDTQRWWLAAATKGLDALSTPAPLPSEPESLAWDWLHRRFANIEAGHDPNDRDYSPDEMVDAFMAGLAAHSVAPAALPDKEAVERAITELEQAAKEVANIEADLADFDGDRRGHHAALEEAEERLWAAKATVYSLASIPSTEGGLGEALDEARALRDFVFDKTPGGEACGREHLRIRRLAAGHVNRMEAFASIPSTEGGLREALAIDHLRRLLMALAGRPDVTRLFGPAERKIYEDARQVVNAALVASPATAQSNTLGRSS